MSQQNKNGRKLKKEKLFKNRIPRSRVQLDIVNRIKASIAKMPAELPDKIIAYQKVIRENGQYHLVYQGSDKLKPLAEYMDKNSISLKKLLKEFKEILKILKNYQLTRDLFPSGINAGNFWIDEAKNIYLMPEEILKVKKNYSSFKLELPAEAFFKAPEIIKGEKWQPESYLFNTAAVFYYFLSSRTIFSDQDNARVLNKIQNEEILALKDIYPKIKPELNDIIMKMLAKNKAERPKLETVVKEFEKIAQKSSLKLKAFSQRKKNINEKRIKKKNRKENFKLFFRLNWKAVLLFSVLIFAIVWGVGTGPEAVITDQTKAEEVVDYFYQAIASKDITLVNEAADFDLQNMGRLISESYVIEKMQNAYRIPDSEKDSTQVYSLENIKTKEVSSSADSKIFKASYEFNFREKNKSYSHNLKDHLYLEKVDSVWKIKKIEGALGEMIKGKYPWRNE